MGYILPVVASTARLRQAADDLSKNLLRPAAGEIDTLDQLPTDHLAALRDSGLFSVLAADAPIPLVFDIGESLVAACLATGFVWAQHQGAVLRLLSAPGPSRDKWLPPLLAGTTIAGVTYSGLPSHGASLRCHRQANGEMILAGQARFVTSWPWIGLLIAWAYNEETDRVYAFAVPSPQEQPETRSTTLTLLAANASATVALSVGSPSGTVADGGWRVSPDQILTSIPGPSGIKTPPASARANATLGLGLLAGIATDLQHVDPRSAEIARAARTNLRNRLDVATGDASKAEEIPAARGELLRSTMDAALALYRSTGSTATLATSLAARRVREAAFAQTTATTSEERRIAQG